MSTFAKRLFAGLATVTLMAACSESEPYSPEDNIDTVEVVEDDDDVMIEVEAPPPVAPQLSFGAMRAAEAAYRASAAYAVYEPEAKDPSAPPIVTAAEFDQLETGMIYGAVMNIIGEEGKLMDESVNGATGALNKRYRWLNGDGSYADVTFTDQRLTLKTQKRLP